MSTNGKRKWSAAEKLRNVLDGMNPSVSVSDLCRREGISANLYYQMVRFDNNRYSVPRSAAFQTVTVKAYIEHIDVVLGSQVIAAHPRSYGKPEQILDPLHYLSTLRRRPAALDHANVFRRWQLPALFGELRSDLEVQHGPNRGMKHYVRVLQLLEEHAIEDVQRAIEMSRGAAGYDAEAILLRVRRRWRSRHRSRCATRAGTTRWQSKRATRTAAKRRANRKCDAASHRGSGYRPCRRRL